MAIVIKGLNGPGEEWALLELQGELKSYSESRFEGKFVGDLHYTKAGIPILIIGHHLMYGKEMLLDKPYALLEKVTHTDTNTQYIVKTIINKKIIFKIRPKPIVSK